MKKSVVFSFIIAISLSSCVSPSSSSEEKSSQESSSSSSQSESSIESISSSESISSNEDGKYQGHAPNGYSLTWEDEFLSSSLSDDWEAQIGDGSDYGVYRWGNNELQYYKRENATVSDGALHITAKKEQASTENETYQYTSARLRTKGKVTMTYGYVEARIKLPAGTGMWPAFWMLPEENFNGAWWPTSGEIDIMEAKGRLLDRYGATLHTGSTSGQDSYRFKDYVFEDSDITDYHCYGVEWTEEYFRFYVDGIGFFSVTPAVYQNSNEAYTSVSKTAPFDRPFHLLLNLAIGGNYDNNRVPDDSFTEAEMLVDYVRIYKRKQR